MEAAASTGRILIGASTAAAIPRANCGPPSGPGYLLRGSPPVEATGEVRFLRVGHDLAPYVPVGLREAVSGSPQPEHRHVSIAFIYLDGVDTLIQRDEPEKAARTLDDLVCSLQVAIDPRHVTFLGTDIASGGGKVILAAGAPASYGEDEEQMLLAFARSSTRSRRFRCGSESTQATFSPARLAPFIVAPIPSWATP